MSSFLRSHDVLFRVLFACFVFAMIHVVPIVEGLGTFGLDIHHRYSDKVNKFLGNDGLPEKDTVDYFTALVHRDHLRGRRLAGDSTPLTFVGGNLTVYIAALAFLQYGAVSLGTPGTEFIVALDTGSDLLWIPCECTNCPRNFTVGSEKISLNIFSVRNSSTVEAITCGNAICSSYHCLKEDNLCSYGTSNLNSPSTSGLLLEDVLQLVTNENQPSPVNTNVTFGCGVVQTGSFLHGGPINGVLGLGRHAISVPSTLARSGLTADSFSMCYGSDAFGRIVFGDKGSLDQSETPFISSTSDPTYTVSVEEVFVGGEATNLQFSALFDSGSSFTSFTGAIYKHLTDSFHSKVEDPPLSGSKFIFEYCYSLSATSSGFESPKAPSLTFKMGGGHHFNITTPLIIIPNKDSTYVYCLAILKSTSLNSIIGQNFMTGYRFVYDREKSVLGWKESDCYDSNESNIAPAPAPAPAPSSNTANSNLTSPSSVAGNASNDSPAGTRLNSFSWTFVMTFFSLFTHYLIVHFI